MTKFDRQVDGTPLEVQALLCEHKEAIVIIVDSIDSSRESNVSVFVKMLENNQGGRLASMLSAILKNLESTYKKRDFSYQ